MSDYSPIERHEYVADCDCRDCAVTTNRELRARIAELEAQQRAGVPGGPGRWVSFEERWPNRSAARDDPSISTTDRVLVTNNLHARSRMGRMSHVWLATPIQSAPGEGIVAFDDGDRLIEGLTHWLDPFAAPEAQIDTGVREGLGQAIDLVREARDSIGAGALAETAEHERSVVSPYLDGIEDELRDKYNAAPEAQEPACAECDGSGAQLTEGAITQRAIDILMGLGMDNAPNDYPKLARLLAKLLKKPALAAAGGRELPDVLFDGHAVYSTLDDRAKYRTSPENVSDVLDAVVRLIRAASQPAQEWGDE